MSTAVRRALYQKMAGDTTLTGLLGTPATNYTQAIYYQNAPDNADHPFVIFNKQAGTPTEAMGDPSALEDDIWLIKAIDLSNTADAAESIQARLSVLLNDATLSISGSVLVYLRRQSDVEFAEVTGQGQFKHAGGLYRLVYD